MGWMYSLASKMPYFQNNVEIPGVELDYKDCAFLGVIALALGIYGVLYAKYILKDALEEARQARLLKQLEFTLRRLLTIFLLLVPRRLQSQIKKITRLDARSNIISIGQRVISPIYN